MRFVLLSGGTERGLFWFGSVCRMKCTKNGLEGAFRSAFWWDGEGAVLVWFGLQNEMHQKWLGGCVSFCFPVRRKEPSEGVTASEDFGAEASKSLGPSKLYAGRRPSFRIVTVPVLLFGPAPPLVPALPPSSASTVRDPHSTSHPPQAPLQAIVSVTLRARPMRSSWSRAASTVEGARPVRRAISPTVVTPSDTHCITLLNGPIAHLQPHSHRTFTITRPSHTYNHTPITHLHPHLEQVERQHSQHPRGRELDANARERPLPPNLAPLRRDRRHARGVGQQEHHERPHGC